MFTDIRFEWDEDKYRENIDNHGITFEEAATVFDDDYSIEMRDEKHSYDEERFIIIGASEEYRVLLVCHCYRVSDTVIRLISARKAKKAEADEYFKRRKR